MNALNVLLVLPTRWQHNAIGRGARFAVPDNYSDVLLIDTIVAMKTTTKRRLQGDSRQLRIGVLRVYSSKLHDSSTNQSINQAVKRCVRCMSEVMTGHVVSGH